jgi:hypothetical protein
MGDHGLTLFGQNFNQALLFGNQGVDFGGFSVEKSGNDLLYFYRRQGSSLFRVGNGMTGGNSTPEVLHRES